MLFIIMVGIWIKMKKYKIYEELVKGYKEALYELMQEHNINPDELYQ